MKVVNVINAGASSSVSCNAYESPTPRTAIRNHTTGTKAIKEVASYCRWGTNTKMVAT